MLVRNPFDRILHIQPYFLEEQQQFVSTTNLLNWLCKKNELCIMRERSNHIQIINFNEWPISSAESAANFTPPELQPTLPTHFPTLYICHTPPPSALPPQPLVGRNAVCKQCNDCAIAALLLSLTLVGSMLAVCSAGHAYHWLRKRLSVCVSESQRVIGPALLAETLRRCRRCRMHIHKRASSEQRQHCVCNCICICVCVGVGIGVRCVCVCVRIFRLISIFRSARFQA